ncbi:LOW QUALITY PROTEIN: cell growth-regulating nucleolar protein-like [Octopus sinensis]|uniref:LOW QUALITY PROTEIN: cell growth-regulating nucleolar protein-like n=1 Tax=Octopus sinensis TaxID=2607531 RepID=A0A6P7T9C7_9MOLL|nr:LOW QUALITY PROTEIN: cell growth-regulating nucleolar protein-like [Octopus sinensis]
MVFFSCSNCGESLKKNQVNKHYSRCRMSMVSCLDCNKEFWGDDFNSHIKCISEEEKYSGKDYKARPAQNKGEVKQDAWLQKVQTAIDKSNSKPNIRNLLERLKDYPNIPRKQAKFENFLQNSLRVRDQWLVKEIWDILMSENASESKEVDGKEDETSVTRCEEKSVDDEIDENKKNKESKREKKAKRSEKQNKKEKKDRRKMIDVNVEDESNNNNGEAMECDETEEKKKKKSKKRKHEEMETVEYSKKRKENDEKENEEGINVNDNEEEEEEVEEPERKSKKIKFDWEETIVSVLKTKEDQKMSMKKVGKKVIAEYLAQGGHAKSNDKLRATFTKKVTKNPRFVCVKDEVRLSRKN